MRTPATIRRFLPLISLSLLTFTSQLAAAAPATAESVLPVTERFSMLIAGADRELGKYQGGTYLLLQPGDAVNQALLAGEKDVAFTGKIVRLNESDGRIVAVIHPFTQLLVRSDADLWADRKEGDNIHVFGRMTAHAGEQAVMIPTVVLAATSDQDLVSARFAGIDSHDYVARLSIAQKLRIEAPTLANEEFWLSAADRAIDAVITDAAVQAERDKNLDLLEQAVIWCSEQLQDPGRAAQVATARWARAQGGAKYDAIARRLRHLGFEFYRDQWRMRGEALTLEFEDRFGSIPWRDADAYYRLGRWTEARAELLPQAVELAHRCYEAGLKANPDHLGCRSALGLAVAGGGLASAEGGGDFTSGNGTLIAGPQGWKRSRVTVEGDASWSDPASESAFVAVSISQTAPEPDLQDQWQALLSSLSQRPDYTPVADEELAISRPARLVAYQYRDGDAVRHRETVMILDAATATAIQVTGGFEPEEREAVHAALRYVAERVRFATPLAK